VLVLLYIATGVVPFCAVTIQLSNPVQKFGIWNMVCFKNNRCTMCIMKVIIYDLSNDMIMLILLMWIGISKCIPGTYYSL